MANKHQQVLIAHQTTIPHYRIPFFNALERMRPSTWRFRVVFDMKELNSPRFFRETINAEQFKFPILEVTTYSVDVGSKKVHYQTFWRQAGRYDLIILENAVNNLTYPLSQIHQLLGRKVAFWGHGWDHAVKEGSGIKAFTEKFKLLQARRADGFFAYTEGVREFLVNHGLAPEYVFTVNNTIDINEQRRLFDKWLPERQTIRQEYALVGKKVLLFVGRFTQNKRIDLLFSAFSRLYAEDQAFHLLMVGGGKFAPELREETGITYLGSIINPDKLAKIYVASDIFSFPGAVGLGPLQAMCYDLPIVTIDSNVHKPEREYLNENNAVILASDTTFELYADTLSQLFGDIGRYNRLRDGIWTSISHLTVENMASNFIRGINAILKS